MVNQPLNADECKITATDAFMFCLAVRAHNRAQISPLQGFANRWGVHTQGDASLALGYLLMPRWGKWQLAQPTALGHDTVRLRESVQEYFLSR
jgi:hypothetical protein